jgi:hypothetical protein
MIKTNARRLMCGFALFVALGYLNDSALASGGRRERSPLGDTITVVTVHASPGETVLLPLEVSSPASRRFSSVQIALRYDRSQLIFDSVTTGFGIVSTGDWIVEANERGDTLLIAAAADSTFAATGVVLTVALTVSAIATDSIFVALLSSVLDTSENGIVNIGGSIIMGIHEPVDVTPQFFSMEQNYPNPFNPATTIRYELPERSLVHLSVFNLLGQEVRSLVDKVEEAGYQSVSFHAEGLPSGLYLYRLTCGSFTTAKKMLLVK